VRQIASVHGGLVVISEAEGGGTLVSMKLWFRARSRESAPSAETDGATMGPGGRLSKEPGVASL